jgi:hypothetical protein
MPIIFQRKEFEICKAAVSSADRIAALLKYPELSVYFVLEEYRITQKEMAKRLGYSQTLISEYINNQKNLSSAVLSRLESTFPMSDTFWRLVHKSCARREGWDV